MKEDTRWPGHIWTEKDVLQILLWAAVLFGGFVLGTVLIYVLFPENVFALAFFLTTGGIVALLAPVVYVLRRKGVTLQQFGVTDPGWKWLVLSLLVGVGVVALGVFLSTLWAKGLGLGQSGGDAFTAETSESVWLTILYAKIFTVLLVSVAEEVFFRGVIFRFLRQQEGFWIAAVLSALVFAALHLSFAALPFLFLLGLATAWVYERSGSLIAPIAVHVIVNNAAVNMYLFTLFS